MTAPDNRPFSILEFSKIMESKFDSILKNTKNIAVGVSGGPDSMCLLWLISGWAAGRKGIKIHALTINHGLRKDSALEAAAVKKNIKKWPCVVHKTLKWTGKKPETRLMEYARAARYDLITDYCLKNKIRHLFLAHHMDDQAETFLFRLAKGSGLDGLSGMRAVQDKEGLFLIRPLLNIPKDRLIATCEAEDIKFFNDPSNESINFSRPRLRGAKKTLEKEGLTSKRLAATAMRLGRASAALNITAQASYKTHTIIKNKTRIVLNCTALKNEPDEIFLRALLLAIHDLRPGASYAPRMEKIEDLFADLIKPEPFRKRTLGGLVFIRNDKTARIEIFLE
jgi:tRNA(Ile)-lysidine synthase